MGIIVLCFPRYFFKKSKKEESEKMKMITDWKVVVVGLLCLTTIELFALSKGINGTLLRIVIGIIALAIGVVIPNPLIKKVKGG